MSACSQASGHQSTGWGGCTGSCHGRSLFLLLLPLPQILTFVANDYQVYLVNKICIFILLTTGLNIVKGFCGQVTVGHVGLYAIGAVSSSLLSIHYGVSFWVAFPIGVFITAMAGLIVGVRPAGGGLSRAGHAGARRIRPDHDRGHPALRLLHGVDASANPGAGDRLLRSNTSSGTITSS